MKEKNILLIPVEENADLQKVHVRNDRGRWTDYEVRLALDKIDGWATYPYQGNMAAAVSDKPSMFLHAVNTRRLIPEYLLKLFRPDLYRGIHLTFDHGLIEGVIRVGAKNGEIELKLRCLFGGLDSSPIAIRINSRDLIHWNMMKTQIEEVPIEKTESGYLLEPESWYGNISSLHSFVIDGAQYEIGVSSQYKTKEGRTVNQLTLPYRKEGKLVPVDGTDSLRIWKRTFNQLEEASFHQKLRFRVAPGVWPDIRILEPDCTADDITAEAYEFQLCIQLKHEDEIILDINGWVLYLKDQSIRDKNGVWMPVGTDNGRIELKIFTDQNCMEIYCGGKVTFLIKTEEDASKVIVGNPFSDEAYFHLEEMQFPCIHIYSAIKGRKITINHLTVYGLRSIWLKEEEYRTIYSENESGQILYQGKHFTIYNNHIKDLKYGGPDAFITKAGDIISPVRIVEEFEWRNTKWGDMSRHVNRTNVWRASYDTSKYPVLYTSLPILDCAARLALDVIYACSGDLYALPSQTGLWSAGLFQGKGEGFGVWLRDSTQTALRCGNLLDRSTARRTLTYTSKQGFNNGTDGPAMAAVGIWDYYLCTNDRSLIYETWHYLRIHANEMLDRYDASLDLVHAAQSTSNDSFAEPENGGYALSTEIYYMNAFEAMAGMGAICGEVPSMVSAWRQAGQRMRESIRSRYWKKTVGYFTSGPFGSEAYIKGYWETSGTEAVLWPRFGLCQKAKRISILRVLDEKYLKEAGIDLFPYRPETNHFVHSVWGVYNAGICSAAAECGKAELILKILMQQIRQCIMNKSFYEVIDCQSEKAWRWPGQLWHAAGFLSIIYYGLCGIHYDTEGMYFTPAIHKEIGAFSVKNLEFGEGIYDLIFQASGTRFLIYMDGEYAGITGTDGYRIKAGSGGNHELSFIPV